MSEIDVQPGRVEYSREAQRDVQDLLLKALGNQDDLSSTIDGLFDSRRQYQIVEVDAADIIGWLKRRSFVLPLGKSYKEACRVWLRWCCLTPFSMALWLSGW